VGSGQVLKSVTFWAYLLGGISVDCSVTMTIPDVTMVAGRVFLSAHFKNLCSPLSISE